MPAPAYRAEIWDLPHKSPWERIVPSVKYGDMALQIEMNDIGYGRLGGLSADPARIAEIIDTANDHGSITRVFDDEDKNIFTFWNEFLDTNYEEGGLATIHGPGIANILDKMVVLPKGDFEEGLPWIWGGENLLANPGFEESSDVVTEYEIVITATGGSFTLGDGVDETSAFSAPFTDLAGTITNALESQISSITDVVVLRLGLSPVTYLIQLLTPPFGVDLAIEDNSVTGGTITMTTEQEGYLSVSPWTIEYNFADSVPDPSAYYIFEGSSAQANSGTYSLHVHAPGPSSPISGRNPGIQQIVSGVTPGQVYQASVWIRPTSAADFFRLYIATPGEEVLASTTPQSLTANTWQELSLDDVLIPEGVTTIAFRVDQTNPYPHDYSPYFVDDAAFIEGEAATTVGNMVQDLIEPIQARGVATWLDVSTFDDSTDSNGDPWMIDTESLTIPPGQTILQLMDSLVDLGYEWEVVWDESLTAYALKIYNTGGLGTDRSGTLTFFPRDGWSPTIYQESLPPYTAVYGTGEPGVSAYEEDAALIAAYGLLEGSAAISGVGLTQVTTLISWLQYQLNLIETQRFAARMNARAIDSKRFGTDWFIGDTANFAFPNSPLGTMTERVQSVQITVPLDHQDTTIAVDFIKTVLFEPPSGTTSAPTSYVLNKFLRKFRKPEEKEAAAPILGSGTPGMMTVSVAAIDATDSSKAKADYICTGTDDHLVIQDAVDSLGDAGGTVWLSEGTFNFTWPGGGADCVLTINPVSIIGMGPQATLIEISGSLSAVNQSAFALNACGWVKDMSIFDNQAATVSACVVMGVDFSGVENLVVFSEGPSVQMNGGYQTCRNVVFDGGSTDGLAVQGFGPFYISDCTFFVEGICIDLQGTGDVHISDCSAFNGTHFIWLDGLSITLSNNESFCDRAIEVASGSSEIIIDGNLFWGNDGIIFTGGFGGGEIIITDNRFEMNDDFAIAVAGTNNLTEFIISGNLFRCDATGSVLVNFDYSGTAGDSIWGMITDNLFIGADTGINLGIDSASVTITGNTFQFLDVGVVGGWSTDIGGGSAISANTFSFCDIGVDFSGGDASQAYAISANAFQNCDVGIRLQDVDGVLISGNNFMWSLFQAILGVSDVDGVHITSNTFDRCGSGANNTYDTILLTATCTNWFIQGNRFRPWATNKARYGVNVSNANCTGAIIVGNDFGEDAYGTGEINEQSDTQLFYPNDATSIGDNFPGTYTPGGSGVDELAELIDVDLTGLADDDFLRYDSTSGTWLAVDIAPGSGADELADLTDVDLTGLADGDILVYDSGSGEWLPETPSGGGGYSPILDVKGSTDDPPDDEFDDSTGMSGATNGLDAKWTAVSGAESAVSLVETGEVERFDLDTRPGWLLIQAGSAADQKVELRQDYTLPDGNSIILAISSPFATSTGNTGISNNELRFGLSLNDNDAGWDAGTFLQLAFDVDVDGIRILANDGTTTFGATSASSAAMNAPTGHLCYLRLMRIGSVIRGFWSTDGSTWMAIGVKTMSPTNVWIFVESIVAADDPVPIVAVKWIRLGGNGLDPW